MNAVDCPFTKIINGSTQFVIPVFQRDYSWTEAQCEQLWKDILKVGGGPADARHFLGSVVYVSTGDSSAGFTRWLLIDGQQRVTTLTLLFTAFRDHIEATKWIGDADGPTAKRVEAYYLKNVQEEGSREHKLRLRNHDQETLISLLDGQPLPKEASEKIRENYDFFREQLLGADLAQVYTGIDRLIVVDVTLDRAKDDPQLIFESLNSTGLDLSQSDLIRNFILMRLPEREQTRLYEAYWLRIENLFRRSEKTFDSFVRDFIALRTTANKQERADSIYFAFRREFGAVVADVPALEDFLGELLRFAGYYAAFSIGTNDASALQESLGRLRHLVGVPAILVMRLFECYQAIRSLSEPEFVQAIELIESYVFRRAICSEQTRAYWQVFANLAYRIDPAKPLESLTVALARQIDSTRFPSDDEFYKALEERDIYGKSLAFDLLARLENFENKEGSDTTSYSIEHIMPQNENLQPEWRAMLGDSWRDVQRTWLHRLGNLTLTGYNSTYSDRSFDEKKTIAGGFAESSVRLNRFVREQRVWTAAVMEQRGRDLSKRALRIWPPLKVDAALIDAAAHGEMRERAERRDVTKVPMSQAARELFDALRVRIKEIDLDIIEIAERKSVSYHAPAFFLEILPRKHQLSLLLALDFIEVDDPHHIARDATQRKFFVNAEHDGGVSVRIADLSQIELAIPIIRQAHARTDAWIPVDIAG